MVEPFVGGGAIFLSAEGFEEYLLSGSNRHLIDLYQVVTERPQQFVDIASRFFDESYRTPERYKEMRCAFNEESDVLMRAAQFFYLNRFGFNGLCRYNRSGQFNVPYGHPKQVPRFPTSKIFAFAKRARRATFLHGDFADVMRITTADDVVYCDPPHLDRYEAVSFRAYAAAGFGMDRQRELADLARELAARGIPVVVSNHDCAIARGL
ncbi:DNA adenine methylase [Paraburkholderia sp. GAS199]